MKILTHISLVALLLVSANASANLISNGDFSTCDFTGWEKDTDGFGDVSFGNDFQMEPVGSSECRASINVDYFDPAGDPFGAPISEAFFANTLFQELDFTGSAGSSFELTIEYEVRSESDSSDPFFIADYFLFGLNDGTGSYFNENGNLGFLVGPTDIDGSFRDLVTFTIDTSFLNQTGWFLDFQVNLGWDFQTGFSDAFGSTLFINDVSMTEILAPTQDVPEPSTIAIFMLSILGIINRKKTPF
jgi:hypothetical protein